jgi:D-arabinose 1-dehydrogenase-like Zn-dependent alcohol dehydrogenase
MRGIVFRGDRELELVRFPDPCPGVNEVVLGVKASGMCGSDLDGYRSPHARPEQRIAGHELAGEILDLGEGVPGEWLGRAVMAHRYAGCGTCDQCRAGWNHLCRSGSLALGVTTHGSHADFVKVPFSSVVAAPEGLSRLAAAAISCGAGAAWSALRRVGLAAEDTVAIFGQGSVGLAATQFAVAMGARVIAIDSNSSRLERARDIGAWKLINDAQVDSIEYSVFDVTRGRGVSKSIETTGVPLLANTAVGVLDVWGTVCWVGPGTTINLDVSERAGTPVTAVTSGAASRSEMANCARFVVERGINLDLLFTQRWRLTEGSVAYRQFDRQTTAKGVFIP